MSAIIREPAVGIDQGAKPAGSKASIRGILSAPIRWIRRHPIRVLLGIVALIAIAWQFENWHGHRALEEQRVLWIAEYGQLTHSDFAVHPVPDEENFFAAPIFESFASGSGSDVEEVRNMPHARFLRMVLPGLEDIGDDLETDQVAAGLKALDVGAWAEAQRESGAEAPAGSSDAEWLHASMPEDPVISGLLEALSRPKSVMLPTSAECWAVGEALGDPFASPIPTIGNITNLARNISYRARAAARAGDAEAALNYAEINLRFVEGASSSGTLVGYLVGLAVSGLSFDMIAECIATEVWSAEQLEEVGALLRRIDLETPAFRSFMLEAFSLHMWPVEDARRSVKKYANSVPDAKVRDWNSAMLWLSNHGPSGWVDANFANHLRWWRMMLIPDTEGDDLVAFSKKLATGVPAVREELAKPMTPRRASAAIAVPTLGNIIGNAARAQTKQRQLLLAIGIESYRLSAGKNPSSIDPLVPTYLPEVPNDPWNRGQPLEFSPGEDGERYRIRSANRELNLAIPAQL